MNPDSNNIQPGAQPATPAPAGPTPPTPPVASQPTPAQPTQAAPASGPLDQIVVPDSNPEMPLESDGFPVMPEPPKKKNTARIVLIVILILAIIGCSVAAAIILMNPSKGGNSGGSNGTPTSNPDIPDTPDAPEETALTDATIKSDILNKLGIAMGVKWEDDHADNGGMLFRDIRLLTEGDIEQSERAFSVWTTLPDDQTGKLTEEQKQAILDENEEYFTAIATYRSDKSVENARAEFGTYTTVYNASTIREEYKKIYGEELPKGAEIDSKSCGYFGYNDTYDIYFMESGCGGASSPRYYYANKFTTDGDNAYIYVSAGFVDGDENGTKIYCDIAEYGNELASCKECGDLDPDTGLDAAVINETNYQSFSEFRVSFAKGEDGNFYFNGAERL